MYKRQARQFAAVHLIPVDVCAGGSLEVHQVAPVSYTHLDVYKRQNPALMVLETLLVSLAAAPIDFPTAAPKLSASLPISRKMCIRDSKVRVYANELAGIVEKALG